MTTESIDALLQNARGPLRLKVEPTPAATAEIDADVAIPAIATQTESSLPANLPSDSEQTLAALCAAFREPIRRRRPTPSYRAAMLAVAVFMVLLPCVYAALTGLAGWWVYRYSTQTLPGLLAAARSILILAAFLTPSVAGTVIVIFLLKPLVSPRGRRMHPIKLLPQAEPRLHAFIEKLCAIVGAPLPSRIEVDCNVNAAASLRGGLRGFFSGEMTLTIGLPLVAGLSLREFTGVLAHEFGHFTQGSAMRVAYVIRSVNAWFFRVVYERDRLDEWLVGTMFSGFNPLTFVSVIANVGVWFSRVVLKTLMYLGHAVSSYLLRQMEYDADHCEALVVGSDTCEATSRRIGVMARAVSDLEHDVLAEWQATLHLPDDFPALFARRLAHLTAEQQARYETELLAEKPSWADSHPTPAQRIAAAQKLAEGGVFAASGPATRLFAHFAPLSQAVSRAHYEDDLDLIVNPELLTPVAGILAAGR